jgi:hypothetical protein
MRAAGIGLVLGALLSAGAALAYDTYDSRKLFDNPIYVSPAPTGGEAADDPRNCIGVEWDDRGAIVVAKVTAGPRVNFIKSPRDDRGKASICPAASGSCREASYLVPGDVVLVGRTQGGFTCVSYQLPKAKGSIWVNGWLPRVALSPLAPQASPATSDWLGTWTHPHGTIEIRQGGLGGRLHIEGLMLEPTAHDFHNGVIDAQTNPKDGTIAFLDDGWMPFETKCDSGCRVRMQRVGTWLVVQDNGDCGGVGVTFTGLYRRKP